MTKKDYEQLVASLRSCREKIECRYKDSEEFATMYYMFNMVVAHVEDALVLNNPKFDEHLFRKAVYK